MPVLGYAVRPPYAGVDGLWQKYLYERTFLRFLTLGEITSFHNYFAFNGNIVYRFKINNRFSFFSGISFEYSQIRFHRQRKDMILALNTGIEILF